MWFDLALQVVLVYNNLACDFFSPENQVGTSGWLLTLVLALDKVHQQVGVAPITKSAKNNSLDWRPALQTETKCMHAACKYKRATTMMDRDRKVRASAKHFGSEDA